MVTFVVDASLAAKWFLPEEQSDLAASFLERQFGNLIAPDLFAVEVGGALVRAANESKISRAVALAGLARLADLLAIAVRLERTLPPLMTVAGELAIDLGHPIKDCVYLALADRLGCPLATCDVRFHGRVGDPARVRLLSSLV